MKSKPVVFLDSGVGGLPYLLEAKRKLPFRDFIYLADNKNFPYGGRDRASLTKIVHEIIGKALNAFDPEAVVIACNTASVVTLSSLRQKYGIPFVGVVPAVKPAAKNTKNGIIGLLATETTIKNIYTDTLIHDFASDCSVRKFAGVKIVDFVENELYKSDSSRTREMLKPAVTFFQKEKIDTLILGCTHFLFVKNILREMLGSNVTVIDSVEGVAAQLKKVLPPRQKEIHGTSGPRYAFYITGNSFNRSKYDLFLKKFQLVWGGTL